MDTRIRLRPWLENRLNDGWIEGLCWVDHEKGIFRIPWKHHSKHTWTELDAAIFKDWAVVTGRFREGIDDPDWPMWKTRLRCALNKAPDIQEVKQRHNLHCDEPFKVYRFISKTESLWRANATRNASMIFDGIPAVNHFPTLNINSIARRNIHPAALAGGKRAGIFIQRFVRPDNSARPIAVIRRANDQMFLKKLSIRAQPQLAAYSEHNLNYGQLDSLEVGAVQEISTFSDENLELNKSHNFQNYSPQNGGLQVSSPQFLRRFLPTINTSNQSLVCTNNLNSSHIVHPFLQDIMEPEYHQLGIRIQHLNIRIKDYIITNPNGCCIYFGRYDEVNSPVAPDPIEAQITRHVSESNRSYVDLLLDNMLRGIIITSSHGSIYIERLCKCAVFVYAPSGNDYIFMKKLCRQECAKVFDFSQFMVDLEYFRQGQGAKPYFEVVLAFGQQLRSGISTDSLLVWCRVASCRAWFQIQKATESSLLTREDMCGSSPINYDQSMTRITEGMPLNSISKTEDDMDIKMQMVDTLNLTSRLPDTLVGSELVIEEGVELQLDDHENLGYEIENIPDDSLLQDANGVDLEQRHLVFMNSNNLMDLKPHLSEDNMLNLNSDV